MGRALDEAEHLALPTLLLAGGEDRLIDPDSSARFAARAPKGLVDYVRVDGLRHEILDEPEREDVWRRVERWIETRLG